MPMLETVEEFAESIADMVGIYGVPIDEYGDGIDDHEDDCKCRMCFVSEMMDRIRESVNHSSLLEGASL